MAALVTLGALLCGCASPGHEGGGDAARGAVVFARHCAPCHGDGGRGDGPGAVGPGTRPADLTDGQLMNLLPDEFLVGVIAGGGPAEGLSPRMPAFRATLSDAEIRDVLAHVRGLARPVFNPDVVKPIHTVPGAPRQPIFFSHLVHVSGYRIICQYCHTGARRGKAAGIPSVERCMGCHRIIGVDDNPEIQKLAGYWTRGEPLPWVRVFKVPEYTYFPHKAHVEAGVVCVHCHGPVDRMRVVGAETGPRLAHDLLRLVGLRPLPRPLTMGWCVDCHREHNARQRTKAPLDCVACHH